jgi:hypothetical protein
MNFGKPEQEQNLRSRGSASGDNMLPFITSDGLMIWAVRDIIFGPNRSFPPIKGFSDLIEKPQTR